MLSGLLLSSLVLRLLSRTALHCESGCRWYVSWSPDIPLAFLFLLVSVARTARSWSLHVASAAWKLKASSARS
ncbi:hypothetical protein CC80DRAFT_312628 [Byssothecium circinans]|uniref:Secreted protein n=1 Tax=Byssothecium circinans TaxID=147558 RepID=A0A6A5U5F4_9PLEO|nr:hypothetical protein CC80DRAFT_312628 [Byssothecium circinans]